MGEKCQRDPALDCDVAVRTAALERRIEALEGWRDDSKQFHKAFYDWQREQIQREARLDEQIKNMNQNLELLLQAQREQQQKPGKRIEALADKLIWAVLAAVVAFVLGRMGL